MVKTAAATGLAVEPVIGYPRQIEIGQAYMFTVDLRPVLPLESWPYPDAEEYVVYCLIDGAPMFRCEPLGEPAVVVHRFGGTYGPARFLVRPTGQAQEGTIELTLVNGWGVPLTVLESPKISLKTGLTDRVSSPGVSAFRLSSESPVGAPATHGDISIRGDVAGRDITITEELAYDVSDLAYNPYLGLASYTYATRAFYGGREPQIRDAVARLTAPGDEPVVLFVTGASGSGKSSFVQAGLLPALNDAYAAQGRQVRWGVMRPGQYPTAALARLLRELGFSEPPDGDWTELLRTPEDLNLLLATQTPPKQINMLIIDQFEEFFTQAELAERDATFALLSGLESFRRLRTHVIATLRADYLAALFDAPMLLERHKRDGIELRAMSSEELSRAIRRPIQEQARLEDKDKRLDPALVDRLVEDVGGDPALLPLLQVTLRALWDEPPHRMVLARYRSLTNSLEQLANQLVEQDRQGHERAAAEREQLMGILLDLVGVSLDDDPRRDVRRALPKQDVLQGHPERAALIEELVSARIVTVWLEQRGETSVEMIEIIHEALLTNWPRLREAIAVQREALQQREWFRLALREWLRNGRSDLYLLQGVRLAEARSLAERNDAALRDPDARSFLEQSVNRSRPWWNRLLRR